MLLYSWNTKCSCLAVTQLNIGFGGDTLKKNAHNNILNETLKHGI